MDLDEWVLLAPRQLRESPVWKVRVFQIAAYVAATAADDAVHLETAPRFSRVVPQLIGAAGSILANVAEGYSRLSRKERIKYYEYALGSANETTSWYHTAASALPAGALDSRLNYLARISQLLLTMIRNERVALRDGSTKRLAASRRDELAP